MYHRYQYPGLKQALYYVPFVLLLGFALDLYIPSIPSMSKSLGVSDTDVQLTLTVFMYGFGFGQLFFGPLSERWGRLKTIICSLILFTIGCVVCVVSQSLDVLLVGRIMQAMGACGSQVAVLAMVRDKYDGKQATTVFTLIKASMSIAPVIAPIMGSFLQIYYGWKASFIALFAYGMLVTFLGFFILDETNQSGTKKTFRELIIPYGRILINPKFLYYSFAAITAQASMFGYFSLSSRFFIEQHGLSEKYFAVLFSINSVVFLIAGFAAAKFIPKIGEFLSTAIAAVFYAIGGLIMIIMDIMLDNFWVLFVPNLVAAAGAAIMLGASTSGALMPFKDNAGNASALFGFFEFIIGGLLGSLVIYNYLSPIFALATLLTIMGSLVLFCYVGNSILLIVRQRILK